MRVGRLLSKTEVILSTRATIGATVVSGQLFILLFGVFRGIVSPGLFLNILMFGMR